MDPLEVMDREDRMWRRGFVFGLLLGIATMAILLPLVLV